MNEGVVLSGDLTEIRLPTLLMSLYRDRETGVLTLEDSRYKKALYIKEGQVVYATSSDLDERLGECLLRRGIITLQQYEASVEELILGRQQGRALVDMGAITPSELVESVTQQLYDVMFSLFHFKTGTYTLELAPFSTLEMITIAIDIPSVIYKGMSRKTSWNEMRPMVGNPSFRLRTAVDQPAFVADLELNPDHEHLLRIARGGLPISSILEASYLSQFDTLRALWIFLTLGLMEREDPKTKARYEAAQHAETVIERYNEVYTFLYHQLAPDNLNNLELMIHDLAKSHPALAANQLDLARFGRLDVDQALVAVRTIPEAERMATLQSFLEEALYALVLECDRRLAPAKRVAVHDYIRRMAGPQGGGEA